MLEVMNAKPLAALAYAAPTDAARGPALSLIHVQIQTRFALRMQALVNFGFGSAPL